MKQLDYLKKQMKYLTDKNLSLNAKGLLSIILLKDEINLEEIKALCNNDMKSIKRASVELWIARYIKYDLNDGKILASPISFKELNEDDYKI